jgi:hypothetical protein
LALIPNYQALQVFWVIAQHLPTLSFRVSNLSELPTQWYDLLEVPPGRTDRANQDRMPRQQAASTAVFNPHADCRGSMRVNPSSLSIPLNTKEEASWLQADVIPLEALGELWSVS